MSQSNQPTISMIVAIARNHAIGRNNQLLWHIPEDLKYFKKVTSGHTVIMGRKTWESIGRPLPNRRNIVVSRGLAQQAHNSLPDGVEVYDSLEKALSAAKAGTDTEVFIIGGGEIYRMALPLTHKIYLTIVGQTIDHADTFFPEIDYSQWNTTEKESLEYGERMLLTRK
jgi:dihydrofolate reductase